MPTVTKENMLQVMCLEGFYCNLQTASEKIIAELQYLSQMDHPKVSFLQRLLQRKQEDPVERERKQLYELLEIISRLKYILEENTPFIIDGELYFRFRSFDPTSRISMRTGKSENPSADLKIFFDDLDTRLSGLKALPNVSNMLASSFGRSFCPSFARENLGLPSSHQKYLSAHKSDQNT